MWPSLAQELETLWDALRSPETAASAGLGALACEIAVSGAPTGLECLFLGHELGEPVRAECVEITSGKRKRITVRVVTCSAVCTKCEQVVKGMAKFVPAGTPQMRDVEERMTLLTARRLLLTRDRTLRREAWLKLGKVVPGGDQTEG